MKSILQQPGRLKSSKSLRFTKEVIQNTAHLDEPGENPEETQNYLRINPISPSLHPPLKSPPPIGLAGRPDDPEVRTVNIRPLDYGHFQQEHVDADKDPKNVLPPLQPVKLQRRGTVGAGKVS